MSDASRSTDDISLIVRRSWPMVRKDFLVTGLVLSLVGSRFVREWFDDVILLQLLYFGGAMLLAWGAARLTYRRLSKRIFVLRKDSLELSSPRRTDVWWFRQIAGVAHLVRYMYGPAYAIVFKYLPLQELSGDSLDAASNPRAVPKVGRINLVYVSYEDSEQLVSEFNLAHDLWRQQRGQSALHNRSIN